MKVGVALADILAGKDATISILAGLASRGSRANADEPHIHFSGRQRAALVNVAQNALVSSKDATRGQMHTRISSRISCSTRQIDRS